MTKKIESVGDGQLSMMNQLEGIKYTDEQKAFVEYKGKDSIILAATAGSGKTFSSVQRMKELLKQGVDPSKIIFFSFTKAATEELQRRVGRDDIKITTIHAFSLGILAKVGKFKKIAVFYDFIKWYKDIKKPAASATQLQKKEFYELIGNLYDDMDYIASSISAYKLQMADDIKTPVPLYLKLYQEFLKKTKSRDFSDMLIEVRDLLKEDKWLKMFRGKYDYVFVDEYQDTSTIQLQIVLSLNAKYYYLIGDRNQSIYGYSGASCNMIEAMLKHRRKTIEMSLSVNFRSDTTIIDNSNKFSSLKAISKSKEKGFVEKYVMFELEPNKKKKNLNLIEVINSHSEIVVLARTNSVIKDLEFEMLKRKIPLKYFNFISPIDFKEWSKGNVHVNLQERLNKVKSYFNNSEQSVFTFIEQNKTSRKFITSIHKSKGREFEHCVIVNSLDPETVQKLGLHKVLNNKQLEKITFDLFDEDNVEPRNIHYVAVSRSKHGLYYMLYKF